MRRLTLADLQRAIREEIHQLRDLVNVIALKVDVLWQERKRRRQTGREDDDQP